MYVCIFPFFHVIIWIYNSIYIEYYDLKKGSRLQSDKGMGRVEWCLSSCRPRLYVFDIQFYWSIYLYRRLSIFIDL